MVLNETRGPLNLSPAQYRLLADRHFGVGADQILSVRPAPAGSAGIDFSYAIHNSDGGEVEHCGNGARCFVRYVRDQGLTAHDSVRVQTLNRVLDLHLQPDGRVQVDMGPARLSWHEIPLAHEADTLHLPLALGPVADPAACSMGNPHATFFVPDVMALPIDTIGPALETDPLFPAKANIGFAEIQSPTRIRLRVWERAAGLTLACGSGACATIVNAARRGLTGRRATIEADGGLLDMEWREDGHVLMTGPVTTSFHGTINLAAYPG